jgi:hypothetical protein
MIFGVCQDCHLHRHNLESAPRGFDGRLLAGLRSKTLKRRDWPGVDGAMANCTRKELSQRSLVRGDLQSLEEKWDVCLRRDICCDLLLYP